MTRQATNLPHSMVVSAAIALAAIVAAQPTTQKPPTLVFKADVTLVAVPVFVTDKSGKAVSGLKADDFEVEDGGKKVPIVAFQAIDVDAPKTAEAQAALPIAVQAATRRQFLMLFDLEYTTLQGLSRARKAAAAFIRQTLAPGDLVAIAMSGPRGLQMLTAFTTDHEFAARAILGMKRDNTTSADPLGLSDQRALSGDARADAEVAEGDTLFKEALEGQWSHSVNAFIENALQLAKTLGPLRGRKQLVLLSAGLPESAWMPGVAPTASARSTSGDPDSNLRLMHDLFRIAGESDVVIHTVDLTGIEGPMELTQQVANAGRPGNLKSPLSKGSGQGTLIAMSHNTGGTYIRPTNDFGKALREVDQVSRHSYVVAFEAAETDRSDRPRSLKIRVRPEGLTVSHRPSYARTTSAPPKDANSVKLQAAEAIAKGLSGGPLQLHLTTLAYRDREGKVNVHAALQIDGETLTQAVKGGQMALQVYGYMMGERGVLDSLNLNTSVDLNKLGESVRNNGIRILTAFPVSPGVADLRFFVRVGAAGLTGSIQRSVTVPSFADGEIFLSAPMFTLPLPGRVVVPFQPQGRPKIEIPFRVGAEPFVPDAAGVLEYGSIREVCVFVWRPRRDGMAPLSVTAEIARSGEPPRPVHIAAPLRIVADVDGFDRYVVTVEPPAGGEGPYILRLNFLDVASGLKAAAETGIVIQKQDSGAKRRSRKAAALAFSRTSWSSGRKA